METSGKLNSEATEPTDQERQFLTLFCLFNQEVNLLEAEDRTGPAGKIIDELRKIWLKGASEKTDQDRNRERTLLEALKGFIRDGAKYLPGCYREEYSEPLLRNLESVQEWSPGTLETLAAAVYDHDNEDELYRKQLEGFLALTSNVYRSFMEPERLTTVDFPQPVSRLPALAMFAPIPTLPPREATQNNQLQENLAFLPFTLPVDEVNRLCGGEVAVVRIPAVYRHHPVLSWGSIAHEVGGHDVLHAYPGLLQELRRGVRELFYKGPDPHTPKLEDKKQYLGLLWQYWTEETAADVYAVMNLGPRYGLALLTFFATLGQQLRRYFKDEKQGDGLPALPVSSIFDPDRNIWVVDYHPPTVLALHAIIGAIRALPISRKDVYGDELEKLIGFCLEKGNKKVIDKYASDPIIRTEKYRTDTVKVVGPFQIKPGNWVWMGPARPPWNQDNSYPIALEEMQGYAQLVGHYIASQELAALGDHSIQDLETWDEVDEAQAEKIMGVILNQFKGVDTALSFMGDDAQLFAGAIGALAISPDDKHYKIVNENLCGALMRSFENDDVWGNPVWHPIAGSNML
jgi:hypothetical protein